MESTSSAGYISMIKNIKQISDVVWEIPKTFKQGMQVPARIYATENILKQMEDTVVEQLTNVACLPGIQKHALCMPDGHSGYGFPIGGVAAFDTETGVISPGGIGFDINCTHPDTRVSLQYGTWLTMKELESRWGNIEINFFNLSNKFKQETKILCQMSRQEKEFLYAIKTETGRELKVTADHPLLTKKGYVNAEDLEKNTFVLLHSFEGIKYERPSSEIVVDKNIIEQTLNKLGKNNAGNSVKQIINFLKKKNILELRQDSPQLPILLKLAGFILGDGVITFVNNKVGFCHFYGKEEDLKEIKSDIEKLGISISKINKRMRHHSIQTKYGISDFKFEECSIIKKSTALAVLFVALGLPYGRKTEKSYRVPAWIMKAPNWLKRLFLASFFGAELSKPSTKKNNQFTFYDLQLNMNKSKLLEQNAFDFLNDIRLLLSELGVESRYPVLVKGNNYVGKISDTIGLRITISSSCSNMLNFLEHVSYEYNQQKRKLASLASAYLRLKKSIIEHRLEVRKKAKELYDLCVEPGEIARRFETQLADKQFILHSIYDRQITIPRISYKFITFEDYAQKNSSGSDGFFWDKIKTIEIIQYDGLVYDVTIDNEHHNFIANSIVTHNCGMRLLKTDLTTKEVQPKLKEIVDLLFKTVPAGVGAKGFVQIKKPQFQEIMTTGVKWCTENDYGWKEDLDRIEENGCINGADVTKVSQKAIDRGINQLGTLGSGNHYLEIQMIKAGQIFDNQIAKKLGIFGNNQVLIMVHCGSRGFGHQIGSDYLQMFEPAMKKYGITVKDRELACAPFNSKEGQDYYQAMACAANMAFANRQVIIHRIREAFSKIFAQDPEKLGMQIIYDVAHNIAKVETHKIDGKKQDLVVHRKGSTRCFGPSRKELPKIFRETGQPVIVGGSMETGSYLCVGTDKAEEETFGSTMHGSGRTMSRTQAVKQFRGEELQKNMQSKGIYVRAVSMSGLAEEAGSAYKDINEVVDTMDKAGVSKKIVALTPIGNVKG